MDEERDQPPGPRRETQREESRAGSSRYRVDLKSLQRAQIIGQSPTLNACLHQLAKAASCDSGVVIQGETGSGKELFARTIHQNSRRQRKPFVVVDCRSLPEELVESLLFGDQLVAGEAKSGLLDQADQGTLFLDEVGELPLSTQKLFCRFLLTHRYRPLNSCYERHSDPRLIATSTQDLGGLARRGQFRSDLLGRLQGQRIKLPALREHPDDIAALSRHLLAAKCRHYRLSDKSFSPELLQMLQLYPWPGNVRELANALEQALLAARYEKLLFARHLPSHIRVQVIRSTVATQPLAHSETGGGEKSYLRELMARCGNNMTEACLAAGLTPSRLYGLLKKHQLFSPQ